MIIPDTIKITDEETNKNADLTIAKPDSLKFKKNTQKIKKLEGG